MPGYRTYFDRLAQFSPLLLPPEIISRLAGIRRLLISPHRVLHALPFHALPWDAEHRYVIERFAVTYVPNLRSMLMTYEKPAMPSLLALGIGDHRIAGRDPSPLPEVDTELEQLQEQWRKRGIKYFCLVGAQASRNRIGALARNGSLSQFTALHIATHGQNVNSDTPMESYLYLYDSIIDGLEIANWQLNAELVVLSACSSGQRAIEDQRRFDLPGDDLFGLQAAFFGAGARRVIGSLWPVLSSAAQTIMTGLHGHLTEGQSPEMALRSAILDYLRRARVKDRSPFYWAPFFLSAVARPVIRP
jgi:CHAT domain-containing protein